MAKYFKKKPYRNGDIISEFIHDLYSSNEYIHILFVRTPTTGDWLDKILIDCPNVLRILYDTHKLKDFSCHPSTNIIEHDTLEQVLGSEGRRFDLICVDTFHEFSYSKSDLSLLFAYLTERGTMVCHDCFPPSNTMAVPKYIDGGWCGETYIAFIDFAFHHPELFYGLLNIDTGIGIISKIQLKLLRNQFNKEKQQKLLSMREDGGEVYTYFHENCKQMMNIIGFV